MKVNMVGFILFAIVIALVKGEDTALNFPKNFLIGTASSGHQVEGAWNISDKAPSSWDDFTHRYPERIFDHSTADVACDSYHKVEEDTNLLKNLGVDYYRFSMSWSRLLPKGHSRYVSKSGVKYYHKILDKLEAKGITPFVTIYHYDHPNFLEKMGGWLNETMVYWYAEYAKFIFREFGPRVKFFSTLNEPGIFCPWAYYYTQFPPGINLTGTGEYLCAHNMLKAHALAYRIYDKEFRPKQKGKVGLVIQCNMPYSKDINDTVSNDLSYEFECGSLAHPIFSKKGDYPDIVKQKVAERSKIQGYSVSRLPTFSKYWIKMLRGSADYFGLNHYTSRVVEPIPKSSILHWPKDEGLKESFDSSWPLSQSAWLRMNPAGLRDILNMIKNKYDNPPVYITENGVSDANDTNDNLRMDYLYNYMKSVLLAMKEDHCNIKSYTIWSFLDSFEWNFGYADRFGLFSVDFNDKNRTRTPKKSVAWLQTVIKTRILREPSLDKSYYTQNDNNNKYNTLKLY